MLREMVGQCKSGFLSWIDDLITKSCLYEPSILTLQICLDFETQTRQIELSHSLSEHPYFHVRV